MRTTNAGDAFARYGGENAWEHEVPMVLIARTAFVASSMMTSSNSVAVIAGTTVAVTITVCPISTVARLGSSVTSHRSLTRGDQARIHRGVIEVFFHD